MTTSTCSADATALPSAFPAVARSMPRRGFLAGLAKLPLIGGSVGADAAFEAQCGVVDDLIAKIVAIPARTAEGVCVKVRAALVASYRDAGLLEKGYFAKLQAKVDRRPPETEELLSLSAMIDASRLGDLTPSGDRRAA